MRAVLCPAEWDEARVTAAIEAEPPMEGRDLATSVSTAQPWDLPAAGPSRGLVACLDYGVKRQSLDLLADAGFDVRVLPAGTSVEEIRALHPAGVFVSNGPGDPAAVPGAAETVRRLAETSVPVFGICLGCQIVALAFGARTWKLPYGHRGGNHPVRNLDTGAVEITSQNHGFAVVADGEIIPGAPDLRVTHVSLNDGTVEGLAHRSLPVFAVQYHPEAAPGPHDSRYLFERFVEAMGANRALPTG
jgi:carbamoyl-phosphate synthase small subunit